ncbi:hypothetical protein EJ03DRAFT_174558 [Teratosphaeria nubilosa]|uniref:Uncharacterized protein n=1 Tax=Teratosphaeria nubilosa TaxID=161662 RepID=A0A6G1L186_9PEZI|nr:hypothetical protein EJ03DRAFT_174558 [Teratosphaeria nubilosa]
MQQRTSQQATRPQSEDDPNLSQRDRNSSHSPPSQAQPGGRNVPARTPSPGSPQHSNTSSFQRNELYREFNVARQGLEEARQQLRAREREMWDNFNVHMLTSSNSSVARFEQHVMFVLREEHQRLHEAEDEYMDVRQTLLDADLSLPSEGSDVSSARPAARSGSGSKRGRPLSPGEQASMKRRRFRMDQRLDSWRAGIAPPSLRNVSSVEGSVVDELAESRSALDLESPHRRQQSVSPWRARLREEYKAGIEAQRSGRK